MAFFDSISKKITEGSQEAVKQTKAFAEVTRLNGQISDLEHTIEQQYTELGKQYYAAHGTDPEEGLAAVVEKIRDCSAQIAQIQSKIYQIKGTVLCPKCGQEVPSTAAFCPVCGEKIVHSAPAEPAAQAENPAAVCPQCSQPVEPGTRFCRICGFKLGE